MDIISIKIQLNVKLTFFEIGLWTILGIYYSLKDIDESLMKHQWNINDQLSDAVRWSFQIVTWNYRDRNFLVLPLSKVIGKRKWFLISRHVPAKRWKIGELWYIFRFLAFDRSTMLFSIHVQVRNRQKKDSSFSQMIRPKVRTLKVWIAVATLTRCQQIIQWSRIENSGSPRMWWPLNENHRWKNTIFSDISVRIDEQLSEPLGFHLCWHLQDYRSTEYSLCRLFSYFFVIPSILLPTKTKKYSIVKDFLHRWRMVVFLIVILWIWSYRNWSAHIRSRTSVISQIEESTSKTSLITARHDSRRSFNCGRKHDSLEILLDNESSKWNFG
jgi:hypothetical protein